MAKTRIITPVNASPDGYFHSANGRVKRVYERNCLGQLVQVPFTYALVTSFDVVKPDFAPVGQIYLECKLGRDEG